MRQGYGGTNDTVSSFIVDNMTSSFSELMKPTITPQGYVINDDNSFKKEFKMLLINIGDYYMDSWYNINEDKSVTFFPFLNNNTPTPLFPKLTNFIDHSNEDIKIRLKEQLLGNPVTKIINLTDLSTLQVNIHDHIILTRNTKS